MLSKEQIAHDITLLEIQLIVEKGMVPENAEYAEDGTLKLNLAKLYADYYPHTLNDVNRYISEAKT